MGRLINPATNKPFVQITPNNQLVELRQQIITAIRAKYDAAQTNSKNELHWRMADSLSPDAANSLAIRRVLRERSRYEVLNNGYLKGIALTLAGDFVGSGPSLKITDRRFPENLKTVIEDQFFRYQKKIKLRKKLWRLRFARLMDGEAFSFTVWNQRLRHGIKFDQRIFECDQVSNPSPPGIYVGREKNEIDGIRFDPATGDPTYYHLLNQHPGEIELFTKNPLEGTWVNSVNVIHWYRQERSWLRGIPETNATLPLWALLRRYTLAVVQNAEIAADFTVLLKSMVPANTNPFPTTGTPGQPSNNVESWFDSFPIDRGLMTVLPDMYDLTQLDPKQPVTMYDTFVNALVQEATRPLLTPRNLALGNSGGYNMASGTLDRQMYRQAIAEDRLSAEEDVLDKILDNWWFEAVRLLDYWDAYPQANGTILEIPRRFSELMYDPPDHIWRWDEVPEHTDPVKVAQAIDILHKGGHISDTDIQEGRFNRSTEDHYRNLEAQESWRRINFTPQTSTTGQNRRGGSVRDTLEDNGIED